MQSPPPTGFWEQEVLAEVGLVTQGILGAGGGAAARPRGSTGTQKGLGNQSEGSGSWGGGWAARARQSCFRQR